MHTWFEKGRSRNRADRARKIGWKGRYRIEGAAFIYANNLSGRVTAILGCPTAQLAQIGRLGNFKYFC